MKAKKKFKLDYRPEIDGLRALAIIPILLFHAKLSFLDNYISGGYLGVDIFFVISGYLITRIILLEHSNHSFSLKRFYTRRLRRILPLQVVVLITFAVLFLFVLMPSQYIKFSESLLASNLLISNIYFLLDINYFSDSAEMVPLIHFWSLSVEEQFYILFPLFLCSFFKQSDLNKKFLLGFLCVLMGLSLALSEFIVQFDLNASFYLLPTRGWELLAGCFLGTAEFFNPNRSKDNKLSSFFAMLGFGIVALSFFLFSEKSLHPGLVTTIPVVGTVLIIWYCHGSDPVSRLFRFKSLRFIGLISFSLYLWHQPIFAGYRLFSISPLKDWELVILIAFCLFISTFTWRFVEKPYRSSHTSHGQKLSLIYVLFVLSSLIAYFGIVYKGFPIRFPPLILSLETFENGFESLDGRDGHHQVCLVGDISQAPTLAIIGDSHSAMLTRSLDKAFRTHHIAGLILPNVMHMSRCPDFYFCPHEKAPDASKILHRNRNIIREKNINIVILLSNYMFRYEMTGFDNGEGGIINAPPSLARTDAEKDVLQSVIREGVQELLDEGRTVVLVYQVPEVGWGVPDRLKKLHLRSLNHEGVSTSYDAYKKRTLYFSAVLDSIHDDPKLIRVHPDHIFCNTFIKNRCATHIEDKVFYIDDNHLSVEGGDLLVEKILSSITL